MGFDVFKKTRAVSDEESVSISSVGMITVSPALTEKYLEKKKYEFVQLLFDDDSKRVGIRPVEKNAEYKYKLIRTSHGRRAAVSGRAFLRTYKLFIEPGNDKFRATSNIKAKFEKGMIVFSGAE